MFTMLCVELKRATQRDQLLPDYNAISKVLSIALLSKFDLLIKSQMSIISCIVLRQKIIKTIRSLTVFNYTTKKDIKDIVSVDNLS